MISLRDADVERMPYTQKEREIIELMADARKRKRAVLSTEVIQVIYRGQKRFPRNARIIVSGILNSLKHKLDKNREEYILENSGRRGPHPMTWELRLRKL